MRPEWGSFYVSPDTQGTGKWNYNPERKKGKISLEPSKNLNCFGPPLPSLCMPQGQVVYTGFPFPLVKDSIAKWPINQLGIPKGKKRKTFWPLFPSQWEILFYPVPLKRKWGNQPSLLLLANSWMGKISFFFPPLWWNRRIERCCCFFW